MRAPKASAGAPLSSLRSCDSTFQNCAVTKRIRARSRATTSPDRGGLHPSRRESRPQLLPEHRRDLVTVEPVEDAARLLCLDEAFVDLARVGERLLDRALRDLVEDHAAHRDARLEHLAEVPGDRLALAVFVRGEVELARVLRELPELLDLVLLVGGDDVERLEVLVDVHAEPRPGLLLQLGRDLGGRRRQIADVPDRGLDDVLRAEESRNRPRLRGRFDDDQAAPATVSRGAAAAACVHSWRHSSRRRLALQRFAIWRRSWRPARVPGRTACRPRCAPDP